MALEHFKEMLQNCKVFSRILFTALLRGARYEDSCCQAVAARSTAWGEHSLVVQQLNWTFPRPLPQHSCPIQGCHHYPSRLLEHPSASGSPTPPGRQEKLGAGLLSLCSSPGSVLGFFIDRLQCHTFGDCCFHGNDTVFVLLLWGSCFMKHDEKNILT